MWSDLVNDSSYEFDNFLPYFQKSIHFTVPNTTLRPENQTVVFDDQAFSPTREPVQVSYPNWANAISSWLVSGLASLGFQEQMGFANGNLLGYGYIGNSIDPKSETRSSSETSFLREAILETNNLIIYKSSVAQKVLFTGKTTTGVQVNSGGSVYDLTANKEVIVSAGTFRSPQLLMTSGIGPQATLEEHGIPIVQVLPGVGQNLWDRLLFGPSFIVDVTTYSQLNNARYAAQADADHIQNQSGPLTNPAADLIGFEKLPSGTVSNSTRAALDKAFTSDWPDVEYLFLDEFSGVPPDGKNYATGFIGLVAPFSRGNVTIVSNDTAINPIVNPNWFADSRDQDVGVAGFKRMRQIWASRAMQAVVLGAEAYPGTNVSSDAEIIEFIKADASSIFHAAGTNAMGSASNPMAVIDSKARVFVVSGLRIVDASSFPLLPPGHPQGTVYGLAERIVDDILSGN